MALVGVELEMLVNEQDTLTTRPPPCAGSISRPLFYDCFKTIQVVTKQSNQMKISYETVLFGKVE